MAASLLPVVLGLAASASAQDWTTIFDACDNLVCVKARVDQLLDRVLSMTTLSIMPGVSLERSDLPDNTTVANLNPQDTLEKLSQLLTTRNINIQLVDISESRGGRKKKNKSGGDLLYLGLLMAAVFLPLKLQALAMVVGKAMLMAKVAVVLAASVLLKKLGHQREHQGHRRSDLVEGVVEPNLLDYENN